MITVSDIACASEPFSACEKSSMVSASGSFATPRNKSSSNLFGK